ncbi:hypothetical protein [Rickettsia sp. MEAM1 (Bemisia tabaci)]|nr:hypothetical protein [Rickettsia sp. MEAM1 (Bemisia tabaci)]
MLLLFYKSFPVIAQYLIYTSLNLTVPYENKKRYQCRNSTIY